MAEPGDPNAPRPFEPDHHDDDLIGFASPAALRGQTRAAAPSRIDPEPDLQAEADLFATTPRHEPTPAFQTATQTSSASPPPAPESIPQWARETPVADRSVGSFARRGEQPAAVDGAMGIYAVYALILFAVPTLGVSAVIALLAVTGRAGPQGAIAASHFMFQQRTLWAGGAVALLGGILIAVGLGVFVLFVLAVWLILRGAAGVLKLKAGRTIERPRAWLF